MNWEVVVAVIVALGFAGLLKVIVPRLRNNAELEIQEEIELKQARVAYLRNDAYRNAAEIAKVEQDIDRKKEELHAKFKRKGLSAEEIADRFRRIRL